MFTKSGLTTILLHLGLVLASAPSIAIKNGTVHGTVCSSVDTSVYRGIPYAQPPVGSLRFMPPQPLHTSFPKSGLNATQFGAVCYQVPGEFAWTEPYQSENCLTLTVYVPPGTKKTSGLPVKVWVHGGGDTGGSASYPLYDLCHMATDSIAVAVQYRLGPLGFLALDKAGIEGNMGIKDAILALEWVQENIASFGGDPKKVVLFGQSSGAGDSYAIASLPQAKSLMTSVICESGGGFTLSPSEIVQTVGAALATAVNCSSSNLECLQSTPAGELSKVYVTLPIEYEGQGSIPNHPSDEVWANANYPNGTDLARPFLDGKLFVQQPLDVGPQVPIVMGSNTNDGSLFVVPAFAAGGPITPQNYTVFLSQFGSQASAVAERFPLSKFNSSGSTEAAVIAAMTYIQTTFAYNCFAYRGLRSAKNSGVPAYGYSFAHKLSCPWLWYDGAPFPSEKEDKVLAQPMHTAELPLVFGNLYNQPFGNGSCDLTQEEHKLSATMKAAWTAMAVSGNPSTSDLKWAAFDECSTQGLFINGTAVVQQLDFSECEFWDQVMQNFGGPEFPWPSNQTCKVSDDARLSSSASAVRTTLKGLTLEGLGLGILLALFV